MRRIMIPAMLLALAACSTRPTPPVELGAETEIPFVRSNGILEWLAAGQGALHIRGVTGDWYLVRTMNRCRRLNTAIGIGFVTVVDELDRHGALLVDGQRCPIRNIVRSAAPEKARKRR